MEYSQDKKKFLREILEAFENISNSAKQGMAEIENLDYYDSIITNNNFTSETIIDISQYSNILEYRHYSHIPLTGRVDVLVEGQIETIYFNNYMAPGNTSANYVIASYISPIGKLLVLDVGEKLTVNGRRYEVKLNTKLNPRLSTNWDSINTNVKYFNGEDKYESFLKFLNEKLENNKINLDFILSEDNSHKGIYEDIATKISIRTQSILDKYQDEIFRLPLQSKVVLTGSPGTGKTTTLIKRLSQKNRIEYLSETEKEIVFSSKSDHSKSWTMFSPNELLLKYLKDGFNREGIPVIRDNVKTWKEYSFYLGRDVLDILKIGDENRKFIINYNINNVQNHNILIELYEKFEKEYCIHFSEIIFEVVTWLNSIKSNLTARISNEISNLFNNNFSDLMKIIRIIESNSRSLNELIKEIVEDTDIDSLIKEKINEVLQNNNNILKEIYNFHSNLKREKSGEEFDEDFEVSKNENSLGYNICKDYIIKYSRKIIRNEVVGEKTYLFKIYNFIMSKGINFSISELTNIGLTDTLKNNKNLLIYPLNKLFNEVNRYYLNFKINNKLFHKEGEYSHIDQLELDMLILLKIKILCNTSSNVNLISAKENEVRKNIEKLKSHFKNQIFIDEVTDFSPIQVSSINLLCNSNISSLFMSGDFNQRLTTFGLKDIKELKWVDSSILEKEISIPYRQSNNLSVFSNAIIKNSTVIYDNQEPKPILKKITDDQSLTSWIIKKINDIHEYLGYYPSIAIFVTNEEEKQKLILSFKNTEYNYNFRIYFSNGEDLGEGYDIRVFNIQDIKGLEFEVVFFIDINSLILNFSDLFIKYLYVGSSRSRTFLGMTYSDKIPEHLFFLKGLDNDLWIK